jgi:hypothetical protein
VGNPEVRRLLGRSRRRRTIILKWILKKWISLIPRLHAIFRNMMVGRGRGGGIDWIDLAVNKDRWRDFVKAVIYFRIP